MAITRIQHLLQKGKVCRVSPEAPVVIILAEFKHEYNTPLFSWRRLEMCGRYIRWKSKFPGEMKGKARLVEVTGAALQLTA